MGVGTTTVPSADAKTTAPAATATGTGTGTGTGSSTRRYLPSAYAPALHDLIARRADSLMKVVTKYCLIPNLDEFRDSVDLCVVDSLAQRWHELFSECSTQSAKALSNADQTGAIDTSAATTTTTTFDGLRYVYGEVTFSSLARFIIKHVPLIPPPAAAATAASGSGGGSGGGGSDQPIKPYRFYDVGSGTGRGVFLAALLHPPNTAGAACGSFGFTHCSGVEILPSLHRAAVSVLQKYQSDIIGPFDILLVSDTPGHVQCRYYSCGRAF